MAYKPKIVKISENSYTVDGIIVFKNMDGLWITTQDLPKESVIAFRQKLGQDENTIKIEK